jgi:serine/threonine protein kinase
VNDVLGPGSPDVDPEPLQRGELVGGRYEISTLLGRGGMGVVYQALDRDLGRTVAIKVLPKPHCDDFRAVERFLRQARAMARIEHKSAVRVFDRGLHADQLPYVVMERLLGRDLRELLRTSGRLPVTRALALGIELCDAVHAAHQQQLVHRDLKPSNVFLAQVEGGEQIKLLDFGIAKIGDASALTGTSDVLGTLAYMAPEQLASGSDASVQSDLYAIACIVFELLAGSPPFRAQSRAELLARIEHDAPPPLASRGAESSPELDLLLARNLAKQASERQAGAQELGDALRAIWAGTEAESGEPGAPRLELANGRFRLQVRLGEGSFGVVYAALDARDGTRVALKRLRALHSDDLYRLKREFRTLDDVVHPNLVRRYELWFEAGEAYFTMELIEGRSPRQAWLAAPERLRSGLRQLATGLAALHRRGLVHRDLKPSNVIVGDDDRVVLLDFGLTVPRGSRSYVAGSPSYMAPEVVEGSIGPAADMYAVGVILHEVLTGQLPAAEAVELGLTGDGAALWPLCCALMAADPAARPTADDMIAWLDAAHTGSAPTVSASRADEGSNEASAFVGRAGELAVLRDAFAQVADGAPRAVLVCGESGIGKTALLASLQRELQPSTIWLTSACRDSEVIPYPALDGAMDALAEYLSNLPRASVEPLLPRNVHALAQLFPVLDRVEAVAERRATHRLPRDPGQVRVLAYAAFHALLHRLCEQRPLVIAIDDVHWIDPDSAALLAYVLGNPEPPALLLLGSVRSDLAAAPTFRSLIESLRISTQELTLSELDAASGVRLARSWLSRSGDDVDPHVLERLVTESGGHPFLLSALAREVSGNAPDLSLDAVLAARYRASPAASQRLLELCAVCERPLPLSLLLAAAEIAGSRLRAADSGSRERRDLGVIGSDRAAALSLRMARLARRVRAFAEDGIEPYHARVRDAVLRDLTLERQRELHRALADALRPHAADHAEALVEHLAACGDGAEAATLALGAAEQASAQLAFDRAAALYAIAIHHGGASDERRAQWLVSRAGALRSAGRNVSAASALHEASLLEGTGERARTLLLEAGELLLFAGEIDAGLTRLAPLLAQAGLELAPDANAAIAAGFAAFGALVEQGVAPARRIAPPTAAERERLELSLMLANGLALIDMRGIPFAVSGFSSALALNDPPLLHRACATFVSLTAGLFFNPLIAPALGLCRELTHALGTPYARALLCSAEGEAAHFSGRFLVAEAAFEQAERILLESCVGAHRELASVRNGAVLIEYAQKGDFQAQLERTLGWQADAAARGDTFHENVLRVAHSIVWIAQDKPAKARTELELAATQWRQGGGAYEVGMLEFFDVLDRYEGRDDVHLRPLQGREDILNSPAASTPFLAGYVHLQRAWGSLRALAAGRHTRGERVLAHEAIRGLRALGPEIWQAVADAYQANFDYLNGARESALEQLAAAEGRFRQLHMRCLAACARMRHGELSGGSFGVRLEREAAAELRQLGVVRPDRWCKAYFSVFDPGEPSDLTLLTSD